MISIHDLAEAVADYARAPEPNPVRMRWNLARERHQFTRDSATAPPWWTEFEALVRSIRLSSIAADSCPVCGEGHATLGIRRDYLACFPMARPAAPTPNDPLIKVCPNCFKAVTTWLRDTLKAA